LSAIEQYIALSVLKVVETFEFPSKVWFANLFMAYLTRQMTAL
jgi:hypothetical protein